jgi:transcriptional regulator with XRE-family HTH domain
MTQKQLAEMCGVSLTTISLYEHDKQDPSLFNATCIADALGVSLDWLAKGKK